MLRTGRRWPVVAAVSLALVAAACGNSGEGTSTGQSQGEQGTPVSGGTLVDYWNFSAGDVPHVDPARAEEIQGAQVGNLVFDGLADYDAKTGDLKPAVAESWSSNADASVWTFKLKRGVTFSNGDPVLPSDFKFAWERMIGKPLASIMAFHVTET
ncbi:MAG: ABC transporter substrate-binding protein, partial [Chloroflexota bacterium]